MNPENHFELWLVSLEITITHIIIAIFQKFPNNKRFQTSSTAALIGSFVDILLWRLLWLIFLCSFIILAGNGRKWMEMDAWDLGATLVLSLLCKIVILSTIPAFHVASTVMNGNDCYWKWQQLFKMATNALTNSNGYLQKGKLRSRYPVER